MLSIARAILADPAILILDEATSSVDTRTEARIQKALLRMMEGCTCFVIAHRLGTIRDADKVIVINDGEIVEQGDHQHFWAQRAFTIICYSVNLSESRSNRSVLTLPFLAREWKSLRTGRQLGGEGISIEHEPA